MADRRSLRSLADEVRALVIRAACRAKAAHVASALSCVDILAALYFRELRLDRKDWARRDVFILSKGHAALALYAALTVKGLLSRRRFATALQDGGSLPGHLDRFSSPAIEASAGSLGHGFSMALGLAHAFKTRGEKRRVFVLIGDGESQEGAVWEGALFSGRLGSDNLTAILDYNNLQGYGRPREICHYEPVAAKWRAFGWETFSVDGHDHAQLLRALRAPHRGRPRIVIARTTKGKGVDFMEDDMRWHYYVVTKELEARALRGLGR